MEFTYHLPVNLIFGRGKSAEVGTLAAGYGHHALVVTGRHSTKKSGLLDAVVGYLAAAGVAATVFDKVAQNPLTTTAEEGASLARAEGCDVVVGLGGGSIMDAAKAIAFLCVNEGDVNDYIFGRKAGTGALPLILVPTTCGTGSEGNGFAVLTNPTTGDKKSLRTNDIVAKASVIDSTLMETMPKGVLASVGFDALCHSMEAYISALAQPLTDLMSVDAIQRVARSLPALYAGKGTPELWDDLTWASTLGGMVINTAGVALPHGMEHPASGLKDIVHGRGLAALTPVITDASYDAAPERYGVIARCLGGSDAADCAGAIRELLASIGLDVTLGDQGIVADDIPWMTQNCLKVSAASINNHPRHFSADQIADLYARAL